MEQRELGVWGAQEGCKDLEMLVERGRILHSRAVFEALANVMTRLKSLFGARAASATAAEEPFRAQDEEELMDIPLRSK